MKIRRGAVLIGACGALLYGTACSAQASDEQRFVAEAVKQIRQRIPGVTVVQQEDPLSVLLKGSDRVESTLNFQRLYGYCRQASADDCAAAQSELIDKVVRNPAPPAPTPASLRIAVRDAQYLRHVPEVVAEPIGEDLFAVLVSHAPDSVATVPPESLASLKLNRKQAWARAWRQTRAKLPALPDAASLAQEPVLFSEQAYLASLLADTAAWRIIADAAGPNLFVIVVADDMILIALAPDGPWLERFKRKVRKDCASELRCLSPNLYRFRDGRWVVSR